MSNKIVGVLLLLVVGVVFYFSWLSDPSFTNETYLPKWLLNWSNQYYNLRTAVPFVAFGYLLGSYSNMKNLTKMGVNENLIFIQNLGIACIVATVAECGQFLIKGRSPDLKDIFFGFMGSLVGALVYNVFKRVRNAE